MKYTILAIALLLGLSCRAQQQPEPVSALNLENIPYPFPVSYIHLDIQGEALQMAYMDIRSDRPNGKTVVLLHGKNFCGAYWEETAKALQDKGYRVVVPDQVGFGKSSKPEHIQYTFQLLAANTKAMLDSLGITKIALLGHSMGGMLATRFTLMYPDVVEQLILENPIGLEDWKLKVPYQSVDAWYAAEMKQTYASMRKYQLTSYYDNKWRPEYTIWLDMQAGWLNSVDYPRIARNAALTYDMIFTQPVCYEFERIGCPTLLIIGQRDRTALGKDRAPKALQASMGNYPVLGRETSKKIKGATLVELPGVGHLPHIEAFWQFIAPLEAFLAE